MQATIENKQEIQIADGAIHQKNETYSRFHFLTKQFTDK